MMQFLNDTQFIYLIGSIVAGLFAVVVGLIANNVREKG